MHEPTLDFNTLFSSQKDFFKSGYTQSYEFRTAQLRKLKQAIQHHEAAIIAALKADFNKPSFETYSSEIGVAYEEINYALKHLKRWMRPKKVGSNLLHFPSYSKIVPEPLGVTLLIAPWNYPFLLVITPLIASIAAGNTSIIKPAEQSVKTAALLEQLIQDTFDTAFVAVVNGKGEEVVPQLMNNLKFDYVFFTGSTAVGKEIAKMAAAKLVPCTLELGGKNPTIVDASAKLKVAARRIAFGKWINAGQTCVAPDYILVHKSVKRAFIEALKEVLKEFYKDDALNSEHYASLIHKERFETLKEFLKVGNVVYGGKSDATALRIEPTLLEGVSIEDSVMQEEIFGPILPILEYSTIAEALEVIERNPKPLAFYVFTEDKKVQDSFIKHLSFGGGMINNTLLYLSNPELPFGGVGNSGYGSYHGKAGFNTFSHYKSVMKTSTWFDLTIKYPPYGKLVNKVVRWFMR